MSDDESFLTRWSRRKRTPALDVEERSTRAEDGGAVPSEVSVNSSSFDNVKTPFDPESLPPIESIGPESDVRAFLVAGVPADLTRAALRRLWASDPKIRDFVGLSENSWDFNAPDSMAGFGPIDKEQAGRAFARLLGDASIEGVPTNSSNMQRRTGEVKRSAGESDRHEPADPTAAVDQQMPDPARTTNDLTQRPKVTPMSQQAPASADHRASRRRRSALPE